MKTLEDLTPEIKAKYQIYKDRCTKDLYSGVEHANFNLAQTTNYIEKIYELCDFQKPAVIIANDPADYKKKFKLLSNNAVLEIIKEIYELKNSEVTSEIQKTIDELYQKVEDMEKEGVPEMDDKSVEVKSHSLFLCSSYHRIYLTWYKFIQDEFKIDHSNKEILNWLYENANNNILRCYFTSGYVLVLRMPKSIVRNEVGFHNVHGPAIEWNEYQMYYINGRKIQPELFKKVVDKELTFDEFIAMDDEDIKAAVITIIKERFGDGTLMEFLGAKVVDEQTIEHSSGYSEIVKLWKTERTYEFLADINENMNQPYSWLELKCPSSGSVYLIETSAHFTDAVEACKFHRPTHVPTEIAYDFKEFNN